MQVVYLSNRPDVLAGTLAAVARCQPWVDDAVVGAPGPAHEAIRRATEQVWPHRLRLLDDVEVSGRTSDELTAMDHVSRNVTLRRAIVEGGHTAPTFLLSDDDYRPLTAVPETDYVAADGRHQGYFFYDLADWPGHVTDYDRAQIRTLALLRLVDAPTLAFGAHMPQVMTVDRWRRVFDTVDEVGAGALVDEWSLYFDLSMQWEPDAFLPPLPFRTLAWPQWPHQWPHQVRPHPIRFENHHPEHEAPGGLFHGLGPVRSDADALARIEAWRAAEAAIAVTDFDPDWIDPWTRGEPLRRAVVQAVRAGRRVSGLARPRPPEP